MRLSLEALETLDAIAEQGSFARAAEVLHRVPSALTYTIKKLEADLGVTLFDRRGKQAKLTAAGERLLADGRNLLRQAELIEQRARRLADGWEAQLTIAIDEIFALNAIFPLIHEFDKLDCGTQVRLTYEIVGAGWDALIERRADLAVGVPGDPPVGYGLSSRPLGTSHYVFAIAPEHPLAKMDEPVPLAELSKYRAVVVANSSRRALLTTGVGIIPGQPVLVVPTELVKIAAQAAGLGIGFVPMHRAAPWLAAGRLVAKKVDVVREAGMSRLAWRTGEDGAALAWFRERLLRDDVREQLFGDEKW
jgi:DNA-binding transcriptional LysR family regulator